MVIRADLTHTHIPSDRTARMLHTHHATELMGTAKKGAADPKAAQAIRQATMYALIKVCLYVCVCLGGWVSVCVCVGVFWREGRARTIDLNTCMQSFYTHAHTHALTHTHTWAQVTR